MDSFDVMARCLPQTVADRLLALPAEVRRTATEIRLRSGRDVVLSMPSGPLLLEGFRLDARAVNACFLELCGHSAYSHGAELAGGYITAAGGCRVGVAGVSVLQAGCHAGFNRITSLNIRIAREIHAQIPPQLKNFFKNGLHTLLIAGPPGSGKTTFLRSLVEQLSNWKRTVAVVDERNEIFNVNSETTGEALPAFCDVLTGCPRAEGILMALRTLKPDYIALDELGSMEDVRALESGLSSGVGFLFTMHAPGREGLLRRPQFRALQKAAAVEGVLYLGPAAGQISEFDAL